MKEKEGIINRSKKNERKGKNKYGKERKRMERK